MPVLWPGHRWEDYQVRLIDNTFSPLNPLGTTFKLRGIRSLYGQFKGELTFALDKRDAYSQFLLERELHFIQVLRDGRSVFEGFQIKLDREDVIEDAEKWIEFAFLPLAFLLHWRIGVANEDNKIDLNLVAAPLDDNFKYIVRRTLGALALTTPTTLLDRVMTDFNVQADLGLGPIIAIDGTGQDTYEIIQQYAAAHKVDWDVRFDANFNPEFRTYYPRRGTDRTEDGPGPDSVRCIFSDEQGNFVKQSYGQDTSDLKTVMYDRSTTIDVAAGPTRRGNWGLREGIIDGGQAHEMQVALNNADLKEWYKLEKFNESPAENYKEWQQHFWVGDEVTWNSVRLGYGPHDDTIAMMEFEIDEAGFEHLTPTFGKPEPDIRDNLRGGGRGKTRPGYTAPTIWHIFGDALTNLDPDATNAIGVVGDGVTVASTEVPATNRTVISTIAAGLPFAVPALTFGAAHAAGAAASVIRSDAVVALGITCPDANTVYPLPAGPNRWTLTSVGATITITGAVANQINFEGVPGATCLWVRADLDSGAGVMSGLHTGVAAEPVMIGADQANLTATPWVGTSGGTKLDVRGLLRVVRGVYCNEASLALWGITGGVPIVHIVDETAAVGGAGGGACRFDVWNAAVRHHMLDADIARASYVRGFFEVHDAAGAIGHSFNAVTGAIILNEQSLGTADIRVEADTNLNGLFFDATGNGAFGVGLVPSYPFDAWGDTDTTCALGRAAVGFNGLGWADFASFSHVDHVGVSFAFGQQAAGDTAINAINGQNIGHRINNVTRMVMSATATMLYSGQDLQVYSDAGITLEASIDGATGRIDSADGYTVALAAANRHALMGDGISGKFRALVAADLGGHVHAVTWDNVATGAGTNHTHVITGDTGAGTAHTHILSGHTAGWVTYGAVCLTGNPVRDSAGNIVYLRTFANAADAANDVNATGEIAYIGTAGHYHNLTGTSGGCTTIAATAVAANESAHTHDEGTLVGANENAHTHLYDQPNTPTGGPA